MYCQRQEITWKCMWLTVVCTWASLLLQLDIFCIYHTYKCDVYERFNHMPKPCWRWKDFRLPVVVPTNIRSLSIVAHDTRNSIRSSSSWTLYTNDTGIANTTVRGATIQSGVISLSLSWRYFMHVISCMCEQGQANCSRLNRPRLLNQHDIWDRCDWPPAFWENNSVTQYDAVWDVFSLTRNRFGKFWGNQTECFRAR